ncbi:hypothetical protein ES703_58415 [subsurface metagenome]
MEQKSTDGIGQWLKEMCEKEGLSLRQAAARAGVSHATIAKAIRTNSTSPETIRKLAHAFGGDGQAARLALEDKLLILAGHRTNHPKEELSEPMARLLDKLSHFSEPELKVIGRFADFLSEMGDKND